MNILIIGSEGFIGLHLVDFFILRNWNVYGVDLMEAGTREYKYTKVSRLSPDLEELFQKVNFRTCINAAGSGDVVYSMTHPLSDFEANSLDVIRFLDVIRRLQPSCKYLHISSAAVYGNPLVLPIKETDRLKPVSPYGWHKLISEQICEEYASIYNISTAIVRPFSVYGPGLKKQLMWDIYKKCLHANEGEDIELWGTGKESRDFIFIEDLVEAFSFIIDFAEMRGEVYNVASGTETTINEITDILLNSFDKKMKSKFNHQLRLGDPINWRADITKLNALGFQPKVNIQQGLIKTAEWLKNFALA